MNRNTHDRLNEAYSRRISMFNQGKEEPMENNVEMPMIFNNDNRKPN